MTVAQLQLTIDLGVAMPQLSLRMVGADKFLEWPTFFPGYRVEGVRQIDTMSSWESWPAEVEIAGGFYRVSIPALSGYCYFRLVRQTATQDPNPGN